MRMTWRTSRQRIERNDFRYVQTAQRTLECAPSEQNQRGEGNKDVNSKYENRIQ